MTPEYISYLTIPIALVSITLYIKDMIRGRAKPNRISWFFWGVAPLLAVYIGHTSGVPTPLLIATFISGFGPLLVVITSFFTKNAYWETTSFDIVCGVLCIIALIIWLTTSHLYLSLTFAILADLFAGIPTIIKSWRYSKTESGAPFVLGMVNSILIMAIMTDFSFQNIAFPLYLITLNAIIIFGLYRKKLKIL